MVNKFVDYKHNPFSGLSNTPQTIISTIDHTIWVTSITVCNRGPAPIRLNFKTVQTLAASLKSPVYAATVAQLVANYNNGTAGIGATLTNSGILAPFSIDGVAPPLSSRIMVKNQVLTYQNGIYTLTTVGNSSVPWVLTRAVDYNSITKIRNGDLIDVQNGTTNAGTSWKLDSTVTTIGTSPITFSSYTPVGTFFRNEWEVKPYETKEVLDEIGVRHLRYSITPYEVNSIISFSNGYTQVFDCDCEYVELNELPMLSI